MCHVHRPRSETTGRKTRPTDRLSQSDSAVSLRQRDLHPIAAAEGGGRPRGSQWPRRPYLFMRFRPKSGLFHIWLLHPDWRERTMNLDQLWNELASNLEREFHHFRSHLKELNISVKPDSTLLTDADLAIESLIMNWIREMDPHPVVIAEEDERHSVRKDVLDYPSRIWVIDPIDGTAEFVEPESREFCSVVCLLEDLVPVSAFVFAPELGRGAAPILVTASVHDAAIRINGHEARDRTGGAEGQWVSVTRSANEAARPFESPLTQIGYNLKTRTTSQTLDMVRTAVDLSSFTDPPLPQFQLFMRKDQKIWDGLAGLCLGKVAGLVSVDADGNSRLPATADILSRPEPAFDSTIMGNEELVTWLLQRI